MADVDTGAGAFPAAAQVTYFPQGGVALAHGSSSGNTTARNWFAYADERTLIFFAQHETNAAWISQGIGSSMILGDINSYKLNDPYAAIVTGQSPAFGYLNGGSCFLSMVLGTTNTRNSAFANQTFGYIRRDHRGLRATNNFAYDLDSVCQYAANTLAYSGGAAFLTYPDPVSGGLITGKRQITCAGVVRGELRGVLVPYNNLTNVDPGTSMDIGGRTYRVVTVQSAVNQAVRYLIDETGPW